MVFQKVPYRALSIGDFYKKGSKGSKVQTLRLANGWTGHAAASLVQWPEPEPMIQRFTLAKGLQSKGRRSTMGDTQGSATGTTSTEDSGKAPEANQTGSTATTGQSLGGQTQGGSTQGGTDSEVLSRLTYLETELGKTRRENQNLRNRFKALANEDESGSANGKGAGSNENSEVLQSLQRMKEGRTRDQLATAASKLNAHDATSIYHYVSDLAAIADEDGNVKNADKIVADVRKAYPFLFKPMVEGGADGAGGSQTQNATDMNSLIRRRLSGMRG